MHVTWACRARLPRLWGRPLLYALVVWFAATIASARADVTTIDVTSAPIVRVNLRQGAVMIRTWDRPAVQIEADPSVLVERKPFRAFRGLGSLPIGAVGSPGSDGYLPPESFVPATALVGSHDSILIRSDLATVPGPVVVTVPSDAPLVFAVARNGPLDVRGYRGGTFVGFTSFGRLSLENVGGTVFVQSGRGAIVASDSSFDRIRARSLDGNVTFERCAARQIETTSIDGSIVFDGGNFEPGLARFESIRGNVAVGSQAASEISAHTASGRIYSNFTSRVQVDGRDGETRATIGAGGPLVTAASGSGNVYLYDGSLRNRALPAQWQAPTATLERPGYRGEGPAAQRTFAPARSVRAFKFRAPNQGEQRRRKANR